MSANYYYRRDSDPDGQWTPIRIVGFIDTPSELEALLGHEEVPRKVSTTSSVAIDISKIYQGRRFVGIVFARYVGRAVFVSPKILYANQRDKYIKIGCSDFTFYFKPYKEKHINAVNTVC
jgi:hypothetical protein